MSSQQSFLIVVLVRLGIQSPPPQLFPSYFRFLYRKTKKCLVSSWCSIPCSSDCVRGGGGKRRRRKLLKEEKHEATEKEKRRGVIHLYTFSFFTLASSQSAAATRKKISNGRLKKLFIKRQCARRRRRRSRSWMRDSSAVAHAHDCGNREAVCSLFISSDFTLTFRSIREIAFRKFDSTIYGIIWWFVMGGRQHVYFLPYQIAVRSKVEPVTAYRELDVYRYHLEMFSPPGWRHNFVLN